MLLHPSYACLQLQYSMQRPTVNADGFLLRLNEWAKHSWSVLQATQLWYRKIDGFKSPVSTTDFNHLDSVENRTHTEIPPQKTSVSPSTTIMLKYRGETPLSTTRGGLKYHLYTTCTVHVPQVENHCQHWYNNSLQCTTVQITRRKLWLYIF